MFHVNVGTANGINALIDASRDHVPMIFTAGRTPLTETGFKGSRDTGIHWEQEMFDQAGMVREFCKWDYELRNGEQLEAVVDRAIEIATTEPCGPVYLTLPREVMAQAIKSFTFEAKPRRGFGTVPGPTAEQIAARGGDFRQGRAAADHRARARRGWRRARRRSPTSRGIRDPGRRVPHHRQRAPDRASDARGIRSRAAS